MAVGYFLSLAVKILIVSYFRTIYIKAARKICINLRVKYFVI